MFRLHKRGHFAIYCRNEQVDGGGRVAAVETYNEQDHQVSAVELCAGDMVCINVSLDDNMDEACGIVASTSSSEEGVFLMIVPGSDAHMCTP